MATSFSVNDTSPAISYFPFADTLSTPNLSAGWNPYYFESGFARSIGETGNGSSSHITSLDGASLQILWHGNSIQLLGNTTDSSLTIKLNGTIVAERVQLPKAFNNLDDADHVLSLTTHMNEVDPRKGTPMVVFQAAQITSLITHNASLSDAYNVTTINDSIINYRGQWTFNQSTHRSSNSGDSVQSSFFGTSIFIRGTTSPDAGNYTVTIDGKSTQLSANSSFTQRDSLLYYTSGLDPRTKHTWSITNNGPGVLDLPIGAITVHAFRGNSNSAPELQQAPVQGKTSLSNGTIAAFVLAGLLAFLLLSGLLYLFGYRRPRQRRMRQTRQEQRETQIKEQESLPAGPMRYIDPLPHPPPPPRRASSGWALWKEEAAGGGKNLSGIDFRRSGTKSSTTESELEEVEYDHTPSHSQQSQRSWSSTLSRPRMFSWGKGKHKKETSSTPSYTLDLYPGNSSDSRKPEISHGSDELSYMSTPPYPSDPSSIGPSTTQRPAHLRRDSEHPLLPFAREPQQNGSKPGRISFSGNNVTTPRQEDMGSVRTNYYDDGKSLLGPGAALEAIRGLSPRTSEVSRSTGDYSEIPQIVHGKKARRAIPSPFTQTDDELPQGDSVVIPERTPSDVEPDERGVFVPQTSSVDGRRQRLSTQSRVHFEESETTATSDAEQLPQSSQPAPTESSLPFPRPKDSQVPATSFLDFGAGSSNASVITRSNETGRSSPPPPSGRLVSRWSTTTAPTSIDHQHENSGGSSVSGPRSRAPSQSFLSLPSSSQSPPFPFPVSLPASPHHPEGHRPSPPTSRYRDSIGAIHRLPPEVVPISPVDSVPISVSSDLRFTHSDTDDSGSVNSALPRHPPLPLQDAAAEQDVMTPTYVVHRVFEDHQTSLAAASPISPSSRFNSFPRRPPSL